MVKKRSMGGWAFLIAVVIAVVAGLWLRAAPEGSVATVLVLLGLIAGFFNVTARESQRFVIASVGLLIAMYLGKRLIEAAALGDYFVGIFSSIALVVVPAVLIVAVREVWKIASE